MFNKYGVDWYLYQWALLPRTAPHINIELSQKEKKELLKKSKAFFLRYTNKWNSEKSEFWYVVKDSFGGLPELSQNTRSKVRRGLKNCEVKKVSLEEIKKFGYEVYFSAMSNYDTQLNILSRQQFQNSKKNQGNYDSWAVYEKGTETMIAYSANRIQDNICNYTEIKFHPNYLKLYASYALFYEMNRYYLETKNFTYVHDGTRSIAHDTNIHNFLLDKFKFRKAYVKLNIIYRWDIGVLVKLLYVFRSIIYKVNHPISNKITILLRQEEIRRSFEK